jgi:hypothetical protein
MRLQANDLGGSFTPLNFMFPNLPLESYRRRGEVHKKMSGCEQFEPYTIIQQDAANIRGCSESRESDRVEKQRVLCDMTKVVSTLQDGRGPSTQCFE